MKASKIIHRNETRIRVDFPYNAEMVLKLRQIPDARWSKTMGAWHVPYTKEAFGQLKELFPDLEIEAETDRIQKDYITVALPEIKDSAIDADKSEKTVLQKAVKLSDKLNPQVEITVTHQHLYVKLPRNETDIQFLRSFKYAKWDNANYQWVIPNYNRNLSLLQSFFAGRRLQVNEKVSLRVTGESEQPIVDKEQFLAVNVHNRTLKLYYGYNKAMIDAIKRLAFCKWNGTDNCWTLPYSEPSLEYIREFAVANGLEWIYREEKKQKVLPGNRSVAMTRANPETYLAKLRELRYSTNTIDTYTYMFRDFINYYADKELEDITEEEIVLYLQYLVTERKVSTSFQNQAINAIHPVGFLK